MQKTATRVFIYSSLLFGFLGVLMVLTGTEPDEKSHGFGLIVSRIFMCTVFVILSSFALSVASKYLKDKS